MFVCRNLLTKAQVLIVGSWLDYVATVLALWRKANLSIAYNGKQMSTGTYTIAQYGIAVPLALDLFTGKQMPIIHIHPNTGNIQSIQR